MGDAMAAAAATSSFEEFVQRQAFVVEPVSTWSAQQVPRRHAPPASPTAGTRHARAAWPVRLGEAAHPTPTLALTHTNTHPGRGRGGLATVRCCAP